MSQTIKAKAKGKGAVTEENMGGGAVFNGRAIEPTGGVNMDILNAHTQAKFVLFNIPKLERANDGPVMRGFVELANGAEHAEPVKVQVAGWAKIARDTGTEYLSLKVANAEGEDRNQITVGPYYGRLFKTAAKTKNGEERVRYFGFIEDAERIGEDHDGKGMYERHWQLAVRARRSVSRDGKTVYISGSLGPAQDSAPDSAEIAF